MSNENRRPVDMSPPVRQPGFVQTPQSSTPGNRTSTYTRGSWRHKSFRMSRSTSPRHNSRPKSPAVPASLTMGSKIPRKSPGSALAAPTQTGTLETTKRSRQLRDRLHQNPTSSSPSGLPVSILPFGLANNWLTDIQVPKRSPSSNKPLPSPPVAHVVDPSSPPMAQRTLIDAEVAGTPSSEEWPAIAPESTPPTGSNAMPTWTANAVNDSVDGNHLATTTSCQEEIGLTYGAPDIPSTPPSTAAHETKSNVAIPCSSSPFEETPHMLINLDSSPDTVVHALTTADDDAVESPLAHKFAVMPQTSSDRTSLLSFDELTEAELVSSAAKAVSRRRKVSNTSHEI